MNIEVKPVHLSIFEGIQKDKVDSALKVVSNEKEPFEKKESAWLEIVYSKNAKQQSDIFNSGRVLNSYSSRSAVNNEDINLTEQYEAKISKTKGKDLTCSGKKVKSMTLLKDKSSQKKSIPKTSVKKTGEVKDQENAEHSEEKLMKKKLNFTHKTNEKEVKRKTSKVMETQISRSFKKPLMAHN